MPRAVRSKPDLPAGNWAVGAKKVIVQDILSLEISSTDFLFKDGYPKLGRTERNLL
jgi:hypothetical protein